MSESLKDKMLDDIFKVQRFDINSVQPDIRLGQITERDKFRAAKQILLGLAVLYVITLIIYMARPAEGSKLLDITTVTFPPLATLILAAYFRDKGH